MKVLMSKNINLLMKRTGAVYIGDATVGQLTTAARQAIQKIGREVPAKTITRDSVKIIIPGAVSKSGKLTNQSLLKTVATLAENGFTPTIEGFSSFVQKVCREKDLFF